MNLPKIRENLLIQDLNDEVLVYDTKAHKSYCLNSTAKIVFNYCDGVQTFADIDLPEDVIYLALDELKNQNLIETNFVSPFAGINRREVIKKVGLASMVALPIIASLIAPTAANAASFTAAACQPCNVDSDCASGNCALDITNNNGSICSDAQDQSLAYAANAQVFSLPEDCGSAGAGYCCAGRGAAFNSSNVCVCNP